jgi:hypothetical protein
MSGAEDKMLDVASGGNEPKPSTTQSGNDNSDQGSSKQESGVHSEQALESQPTGSASRDATKKGKLAVAEEVISADEVNLEKMQERVSRDELQKHPAIVLISSFLSSGFFFLLLGGGFLFLAQHNMATNHAGITFVLVVLGVALLLYGTGTQGMGQFKAEGAAAYNVAIAGGAGAIAFAAAYGIIKYSPQMRAAFQPEKKFVRLLVQSNDGSTSLPLYFSSFELDGVLSLQSDSGSWSRSISRMSSTTQSAILQANRGARLSNR